jgi:hypothetical protein
MPEFEVDVCVYGSLARQRGGKHYAKFNATLPENGRLGDLIAWLGFTPEERGYLFVNAVLCEAPGLPVGTDVPLGPGDHIGIFSVDYPWPYQYRDGIRMSPQLTEALQERGPMRHTYKK